MATTSPALGIQNFFSTTLSAPIVATDTIIFLNTLPTPTQGFLVLNLGGANQEVIFYTSKGANYVQCTSVADGRGQDNTSAAAHSAGESVKMTVTAGYWKALQDMTGVTAGAVGAIPFATGWTTMPAVTPNTVTYNGNRNYSVVFNSTDLTSYISNGMRLKLTRTVTAPTQCTSLNGTTQYYSKTSPTGMTFTNNFTVSAWVKLSAYGTVQGIISRIDGAITNGFLFYLNGSGQLIIAGYGTAGARKEWTSYQSIPLNKWVHVAATLDMSGNTTATNKIFIDGVDVPAQQTSNGAVTALIQPSTAFQIGAYNSAQFFNGKIAQAAVFSAVLNTATIQSYISQGLAGTETSLISAYSFNNSINDLNANANNLTANGSAVATNADSPFAGGANASTAYTAGTTEYGEVFGVSFSTNTTMIVQVPDGYSIPTSGGVSALSYSTQAVPLGWPLNGGITQLGYIALLTGTMGTTNTPTSWLGFTMPVYVPNGRKVKLRIYGNITAGTTSSGMEIGICKTSVSAANALTSNLTRCIAGTVPQGVYAESSDNTSGSVTYVGYWRSVDAATLTGLLVESGNPYIAWMSVELV